MYLNEMHSKVRIGNHMSYLFKNGRKQGKALSLLILSVALVCHYEGQGKPGGTEIKRDTSAGGLC
jgi:hypothetical protein